MKARILIDTDGRVLSIVRGESDLVSLNTPSNALFVDTTEPYVDFSYYFSFDDNVFIPKGAAPTLDHSFDYTTKQWVDLRTLEEFKNTKWADIKLERNHQEFNGFNYMGNTYDSDLVSQSRISVAAQSGNDQVWTLKNNETIALSAAQMVEVYNALQKHVSEVHERGRKARAAIYSSSSVSEVSAIKY